MLKRTLLSRVSLLIVLSAAPRLAAQERGAAALGELVEGLGTTSRVLMIGAHPDDEDTQLIAYLAKARHIETAYLSLTPRRRRPESDRQRARSGARNDPHRRAARGAADRRRTSVLHARVRFRILENDRRDVPALAEGFDPQGRRRDRARVPAAGHHLRVDRARRPTDTGTTSSRASSRATCSTPRPTRVHFPAVAGRRAQAVGARRSSIVCGAAAPAVR